MTNIDHDSVAAYVVVIIIARLGREACDGYPKSSGDMVPRAPRSVNKDL